LTHPSSASRSCGIFDRITPKASSAIRARSVFSGQYFLDHPPRTDSHDVGDHRIQLDVGLFEDLFDPLTDAGPVVHQIGPRAAQIA
jgi:hypothetical protein